jgi:hypothetical protein
MACLASAYDSLWCFLLVITVLSTMVTMEADLPAPREEQSLEEHRWSPSLIGVGGSRSPHRSPCRWSLHLATGRGKEKQRRRMQSTSGNAGEPGAAIESFSASGRPFFCKVPHRCSALWYHYRVEPNKIRKISLHRNPMVTWSHYRFYYHWWKQTRTMSTRHKVWIKYYTTNHLLHHWEMPIHSKI